MKRVLVLLVILFMAAHILPAAGYASDYQGKESDDSVFQRLGDLITGKYEVEGEPIKKKGIIQVMANEVNSMEPAPVK